MRAARTAPVRLASSALGCAPEPPERPNLLPVSADMLRAGHVGAYGADFAQRARAADPDDIALARRSADAWEAAGRSREALAAYRRALALDPHSYRDHMHAAIHLARLGRLDEAEDHVARAGAVAADPRARRMLTAGLRDGGAPERALLLYRGLLDESPGDAALRAELARTEAAADGAPPARPAP